MERLPEPESGMSMKALSLRFWTPAFAGVTSLFQRAACAKLKRGNLSMNRQEKMFLALGGINLALVVMLGAFGAHGLKRILSPEMLAVYQTAVQYHAWHALGLCLVGTVIGRFPSKRLTVAGYLLFTGILFFSGSLYLLSITGLSAFGAVTPLGGIAFILGWIFFVVTVLGVSATKS
jgi:uncharacterized membrane protein YgdD (TMEM256/DUF423 family)